MKSQGRDSTRRALQVLLALQGHSFEGLRLKQLAESLRTSSSTTLKDLELLASEGFAERIPGREDCWRLTPRVVQIAIAHHRELSRLRQNIDDFDQRYTREPS